VFVVKIMEIGKIENRKTFAEVQTQNLNQNNRERKVAELERRAIAIRSFQDVINLEG